MTTLTKKTKLVIPRIKPYVPTRDPLHNMGLSKYGNSIHQGAEHVEQIMCLEKNNIRRWVTGLDEFAPEVQELRKPATQNEYEAKVIDIRTKVAYIEQSILANVIEKELIHDVKNSKAFWDQVQMCRPDKHDFWASKTIVLTNEPQFLNPMDPEHLLLLTVIEAGGFTSVAPSLETAQRTARTFKFYLDRGNDTAVSSSELKKIKNRAAAELQSLSDKNPTKLFYLAKIIDKASSRYTMGTPPEVIYNYLDEYISGNGSESGKAAAERFTRLATTDNNTLKISAIVADAILLKHFETNVEGIIHHAATNARLGRTVEEVTSYLNNPQHQDILDKVTQEVEAGWGM